LHYRCKRLDAYRFVPTTEKYIDADLHIGQNEIPRCQNCPQRIRRFPVKWRFSRTPQPGWTDAQEPWQTTTKTRTSRPTLPWCSNINL